MIREEAIKGLKVLRKDFSGYKPNCGAKMESEDKE